MGSHHQSLFKENVGKTKKYKEWPTIGEKGFESRLRTGKVLAPHASVMKTTTFNRVRLKNKVTFNYLSSLENMNYSLLYFLLSRKGNQIFIFRNKRDFILFLDFFWDQQGICPRSDLRSSL